MAQDASRWWHDEARERFWLESTDREDIGADLRAPLVNVSGKPDWRYDLFREARPGDVVFHYDKRRGAITSCSRIAGPEGLRPIVWVARGSYARKRGAEPEEVPGYFVPLTDHRELSPPLTLAAIRTAKSELKAIVDRLEGIHRKALYFPFELKNRPVRPNQGYAFKLPADFVHAFSALAQITGPDTLKLNLPATPSGGGHQLTLVRRMAAEINAAAPDYEIGRLQEIRKELRGLRRLPGRQIFSDRSIFDEWAFHSGGRDELQFNIGLDEFPDGSLAFRAGVAFSLEPSQSLPDWTVLIPSIARFNDFMREQAEQFDDMRMWHWRNGERSADQLPGPIDPETVSSGAFVFLGARKRPDAVDCHWCLDTFERLLTIYRAVQEGRAAEAPPIPAETLRLDRGAVSKTTGWATATLKEQILNIFLRHNEIQNRLKAQLDAAGGIRVVLEARVGQRAIDIVTENGEQLWFYEIKTAGSVRQCLREAIGQLLEYAFWPGATRPTKLIVVGEPPPTKELDAYLETLNAFLPIRLEYHSLPLN
jgi:hypothetical protein